jgi:hypothetical protein
MSKRIRAFAVFISLWTLACSSDRYTLQEKAGSKVRLDKQTGELAVLNGDHLVFVKAPGVPTADTTLSKPRHWPMDSVGSKSPMALELVTTKWADGRFFYQVFLGPISDDIKNAAESPRSRITLYLQDSAGFNLAEIPIPLNEMVRTHYSTGLGMSANSSSELERSAYRQTKTIRVGWAGF